MGENCRDVQLGYLPIIILINWVVQGWKWYSTSRTRGVWMPVFGNSVTIIVGWGGIRYFHGAQVFSLRYLQKYHGDVYSMLESQKAETKFKSAQKKNPGDGYSNPLYFISQLRIPDTRLINIYDQSQALKVMNCNLKCDLK